MTCDRGSMIYFREPGEMSEECILERIVVRDGTEAVERISAREAAWLGFKISTALARYHDAVRRGDEADASVRFPIPAKEVESQ